MVEKMAKCKFMYQSINTTNKLTKALEVLANLEGRSVYPIIVTPFSVVITYTII